MLKNNKNFCKDCSKPSIYHVATWADELINQFLPRIPLPKKFEQFFNLTLENFFIFLGLFSPQSDFSYSGIQLRTVCFMEEAKKRGISFKVFYGPFGYTNYFQAKINGKIFRLESLPLANFASRLSLQIVDDKEKSKQRLKKGKFPIAEGKAFWFWQKRKAIEFGTNQIGFPLVVKPRSGSLSRHVTTNIQNLSRLKEAMSKAISYSPVFLLEKFIPDTFVHRATVVDFDYIFCVKQAPANVKGDGTSSIRDLIDKKNKDPRRGEEGQKGFVLYKIVENEVTERLLAEKGYDILSIPEKNEIVWLQKDSFLRLGGDLIELTPQIHQDNSRLFRDIARFFDIRLVGIDFLCQDISVSWKNQRCAILELNSVPCIEMHHFPSEGDPQNAAKAVVNLFLKYYL